MLLTVYNPEVIYRLFLNYTSVLLCHKGLVETITTPGFIPKPNMVETLMSRLSFTLIDLTSSFKSSPTHLGTVFHPKILSVYISFPVRSLKWEGHWVRFYFYTLTVHLNSLSLLHQPTQSLVLPLDTRTRTLSTIPGSIVRERNSVFSLITKPWSHVPFN